MPPLGAPKKPWESVRKHRVKDIGSFWKSLKYPKVLFLLLFCFLGCPATPSQERSRRKTWSSRIRRNLKQAPFFLGVSGSWSEVIFIIPHFVEITQRYPPFCRPRMKENRKSKDWFRISFLILDFFFTTALSQTARFWTIFGKRHPKIPKLYQESLLLLRNLGSQD